jgi:exosome complex exonuclease RRP6
MLHRYNHPYAAEIEASCYPEEVYTARAPVPYLSLNESQAIFVDTKEGVENMLAELREASEIAIDLEHHDTHSYVGIVCLMQISTRQKDWIIDTLVPWREDLQMLNEVFADPKILKVFQGSTMDMIWLQRDLGLYVVGLFDTFHASTALGFPQKSLKYLLERFCDFRTNKKYQMADWRIRPVPGEMLSYARSDTHYLLFIYDNLRNMLLEASSPDNSLINYVLEESKKEALQRYERAGYDVEKGLGPIGWFSALARRSLRLSPEQFAVYRAVHEWRDRTARASDEGLAFIMSQATLLTIAETMPMSVPALLNTTNPVSIAIKAASHELVEIIKKSKEAGREGSTFAEVMRENEAFMPHRRNSRRVPERVQQGQGIGATLQMLNENGDVGSDADRSFTSRFWGTVTKPLAATATRFMAPLNDALRLVLPLPALGADSFTNPSQPMTLEPAVEPSTQTPTHINGSIAKAQSNVFVLKEVDRISKRKIVEADLDTPGDSPPPSTGLGTNSDYPPLHDTTFDASASSAEIKARRNEEKRQKKASRLADANRDTLNEPFDYANAESILHAKPDRTRPDGSVKVLQEFDPYAKALDGPQGLKRIRKETAGRSFTFKK